MKKKIFAIFAVVLVVALATVGLAACNGDGDGGNQTEYTMVMPNGAPMLAAAKIFSGDNVIDGKKINAAVVAENQVAGEMGKGDADIIIMPTNAAAGLFNKGAAYQLVSVVTKGNLYIIGKNAGTLDLSDLAGKKVVAIGQNNVPGKVFEKLLSDNGIGFVSDGTTDLSKVMIDYVAGAEAVKGKLDSGNADFGLAAEPAVTNFTASGTYKVNIDIQAEWEAKTGDYGFPQAALFVKKTVIEKDASFVKVLQAALESNLTWIEENKDTINSVFENTAATATFPAKSIAGCNVSATKAADAKTWVKGFLASIMGAENVPDDSFFYVPADA